MGINPTGAQIERLLEQVDNFVVRFCVVLMRVVFADSQLRAGQTEESALIPLDRFEQVSATQEHLSPGAQNIF